MSRLVSLLIVLLAIAVATPVLAEERLSLSGQMRVRGFHVDNQFDFNDDATGSSNYYNQRLRIGGKLSVAEGVSVNFRVDLSEKTWGASDSMNPGGLNDGSNQAFIAVDKDMFSLKAGRMFYSIGNAIAVDHNAEGAVFTLKGAIPVEIGAFKVAENATNKDDDIDVYTVAVKHSTDMYNAVVFGGWARNGGLDAVPSEVVFVNDANVNCVVDGDDLVCPNAEILSTPAVSGVNPSDIYLFGLQTAMKLDPINLNFELNYFTGEDDVNGGADYKGIQAYVDANMAISETITAGAAIFYAQGQTGTDVQVTDLTNDGSFLPETYSFMATQFNVLPASTFNDTFDPTGNGTGVIGGQIYGQFKVMNDLSLRAVVGYFEPEEDDVTYESLITAIGSARYALAANTNLDFVAAYTIPETRGSASDDPALLTAFNLNVNF